MALFPSRVILAGILGTLGLRVEHGSNVFYPVCVGSPLAREYRWASQRNETACEGSSELHSPRRRPPWSRDEGSNRSDRAQSPRRCRTDWPFRSSIRSAGPGGHCGSARPAGCRLPGGREPRGAPGESRRIGRLANSAGSCRIGPCGLSHHLARLTLAPRPRRTPEDRAYFDREWGCDRADTVSARRGL
jgi:hypothetical protein